MITAINRFIHCFWLSTKVCSYSNCSQTEESKKCVVGELPSCDFPLSLIDMFQRPPDPLDPETQPLLRFRWVRKDKEWKLQSAMMVFQARMEEVGEPLLGGCQKRF